MASGFGAIGWRGREYRALPIPAHGSEQWGLTPLLAARCGERYVSPAMPTSTDRLSAALADRYRIERELGQGGMAVVYQAHDVRHDRKVAI